MQLISNARDWWRLWSVRLSAVGLSLEILPTILEFWNAAPAEVKAMLPEPYVHFLALAFFAAAIIARLVKQPKLENGNGQPAA